MKDLNSKKQWSKCCVSIKQLLILINQINSVGWASRATIIKATRFDVVIFITFIDPDYLFFMKYECTKKLVFFISNYNGIDVIHTNRKVWAKIIYFTIWVYCHRWWYKAGKGSNWLISALCFTSLIQSHSLN